MASRLNRSREERGREEKRKRTHRERRRGVHKSQERREKAWQKQQVFNRNKKLEEGKGNPWVSEV